MSELRRESCGRRNQTDKRTARVEITIPSPQRRCFTTQQFQDGLQRNLWLVRTVEHRGKDLQQPLGRSIVNQRIRSVEIAQRALEAMATRFKYKPLVAASFAEKDRQAELEWHIEPWDATTQSYAAEVVKRVAAVR